MFTLIGKHSLTAFFSHIADLLIKLRKLLVSERDFFLGPVLSDKRLYRITEFRERSCDRRNKRCRARKSEHGHYYRRDIVVPAHILISAVNTVLALNSRYVPSVLIIRITAVKPNFTRCAVCPAILKLNAFRCVGNVGIFRRNKIYLTARSHIFHRAYVAHCLNDAAQILIVGVFL